MSEQGTAGAESVTGAQSLIRSLESAGAENIFGIPGGAILPAYDPLYDSRIRHILVRHEQGAGHAAQGYAVATGKVGVCMATSGPGATNLVTPIADAYMDSVPMVADHRPGGAPPRSAPTPSRRPTSAASRCRSPSTTSWSPTPTRSRASSPRRSTSPPPAAPARCSSTSRSPRSRRRPPSRWPTELNLPGYRPVTRPHSKQIREATRLMLEARRPVLYVGGGVIRARRRKELRTLAELTGMPGRHHADGARRVPRQPPAAPRHARHARHRRRGGRPAEERPDHQPRRPLRRPRHRQPRLLRPRRQGDPRRHRPGRDRQEPRGRRADRRRRPRGDRRPGRRAPGRAGAGPHRRLRGLGEVPGRREAAVPARATTPRPRASPRSTSSSGSARSPVPRRSTSPAWASTRCGPPTTSSTRTRTPGSTPAASARWASRCRPRWAPRSAAPTRRCGRSTATAASR